MTKDFAQNDKKQKNNKLNNQKTTMKNLAEQIKDTKNHNKISGYAQLLEGKKRKDFIIEISNHNLLVAARATVNCAKDEELVIFLIEKAQKAGENEKMQKKVNVDAILSLLVFRKYLLATDLIFVENKDTEDFKNENLDELKELENESVNADIIGFFIGLSPTYDVALQFYNSLSILGVQANTSCFTNLIYKSFNYKIALQWYEQIHIENLTPTTISFNNLISKSPNYQTALQWYEQIHIENLTPNINTYNNLIYKSPNYQTALQWYKQIQIENLTPSTYTYQGMISVARYLKDAKQRNEIATKYYYKALQIETNFSNVVSYCCMIFFSLSYLEAQHYFLAMEKAGFKADKQAWDLLSEKANNGADKKKLQVLMKERNYVAVPTLSKEILDKFKDFGKK